jgi:hypothetical protein
VGVTDGSRELPGRKPVTRDNIIIIIIIIIIICKSGNVVCVVHVECMGKEKYIRVLVRGSEGNSLLECYKIKSNLLVQFEVCFFGCLL